MNFQLSIVTVCLNADTYIDNCINSIISQKPETVEYLIVDGGSQDQTLDKINTHISDIDLVISEPDTGIYNAMNKGINLSHGDYILMVNADDFLEAGAVERILEAINSSGECDLIHGKIRVVDRSGNESKLVGPSTGAVARLLSTPFKHPTCVVKRSWYDRFGAYDETFHTAADYDFMLRALKNGVAHHYIPAVISNFRTAGVTSGTAGVSNPHEIYECLYRYIGSQFLARLCVWYRIIRHIARAQLAR